MRKRIIKLLKKGFSPEQIVGRSRLEGIAMVSHETIYRWIWEDKRRGGKLHKYLRRQGRRYAKRGSKNAGRGFIQAGWILMSVRDSGTEGEIW